MNNNIRFIIDFAMLIIGALGSADVFGMFPNIAFKLAFSVCMIAGCIDASVLIYLIDKQNSEGKKK